ncbi:hypothetical protein [Chryseobacterium tongliaoense]|uniref:hypothetical protein n=1 Tax=Chryseobacterium tongliaoense TaxID=3240933 RepID=UPI0035167B44
MKKLAAIFLLALSVPTHSYAQNIEAKAENVRTSIKSENHTSSSILLWMRTDKPRQAGMERWKYPHSQIISANKGLEEYRQIHFTEENNGLWPLINGVETSIPSDRKIDGVADVTLKNIFSVFRGKKQNKLAYEDEVNLFKRTLLYAALGNASKSYSLNDSDEKIQARSMVFFRIKEGVDKKEFKKFINNELTPALANLRVLKELRNKVYMPWNQKQWNTPNVQHDNAEEVQFQASLILGFSDKNAQDTFFRSDEVKKLSDRIALFCSAAHAYEIQETFTFVKGGKKLAEYQK